MLIFFTRLSCDSRTTFVQVSRTCGREILAKFTVQNFRSRATFLRKRDPHDYLAKSLRLSGEKIKLSDIRTNVMRHSHDCHTNENENKATFVGTS